MAKSKKPRKKYNPNKNLCQTPVTVRYSKEEGDRMKYRIYFHLGRLITDDCGAGDYLALEFRIRVGRELAKLFDGNDAIEMMDKGLSLLQTMKENRIITGKWKINDVLQNELRSVLSLVDDIQDQTTRKEQLPIFIAAEKQIEHSLFDNLP